MESWLFHFLASNNGVKNSFLCHLADTQHFLSALVTYGEPTRNNYYMHEVNASNRAFWENKRQIHGETRYSPADGFFMQFLFAAF